MQHLHKSCNTTTIFAPCSAPHFQQTCQVSGDKIHLSVMSVSRHVYHSQMRSNPKLLDELKFFGGGRSVTKNSESASTAFGLVQVVHRVRQLKNNFGIKRKHRTRPNSTARDVVRQWGSRSKSGMARRYGGVLYIGICLLKVELRPR